MTHWYLFPLVLFLQCVNPIFVLVSFGVRLRYTQNLDMFDNSRCRLWDNSMVEDHHWIICQLHQFVIRCPVNIPSTERLTHQMRTVTTSHDCLMWLTQANPQILPQIDELVLFPQIHTGSVGRITNIPGVIGNVSYEGNPGGPCWFVVVKQPWDDDTVTISDYGHGGREQSQKCFVSCKLELRDSSMISVTCSLVQSFFLLRCWSIIIWRRLLCRSCLIWKWRKYELNLWSYVILLQCYVYMHICINVSSILTIRSISLYLFLDLHDFKPCHKWHLHLLLIRARSSRLRLQKRFSQANIKSCKHGSHEMAGVKSTSTPEWRSFWEFWFPITGLFLKRLKAGLSSGEKSGSAQKVSEIWYKVIEIWYKDSDVEQGHLGVKLQLRRSDHPKVWKALS